MEVRTIFIYSILNPHLDYHDITNGKVISHIISENRSRTYVVKNNKLYIIYQSRYFEDIFAIIPDGIILELDIMQMEEMNIGIKKVKKIKDIPIVATGEMPKDLTEYMSYDKIFKNLDHIKYFENPKDALKELERYDILSI